MTGNVYEWCSDWFAYYSSSAQLDPKGPNSGTHRIARGGAHAGSSWYQGLSRRTYYNPRFRSPAFGLRLAL